MDAAIVSLPAPTTGLRTTALGGQRAVAALPVGHRHAVRTEIRLDQMAPERIVVLPREANRPFYDAVLASCRIVGLSPTLVEMPDGNVEQALLAAASGAGMALVPEVRVRALRSARRPLGAARRRSACLCGGRGDLRDTAHMPTVAFLRAIASEDARRTRGLRDAPVSAAA